MREVLADDSVRIEAVFGTADWAEKHRVLLQKYQEKLTVITPGELRQISQLKTPNQAFLVAEQRNNDWTVADVKSGFSLYLDGIQDPGNLGTMLRTADWFGWQYVFLSPLCVDFYNPKVIQASMGAFLRVKAPIVTLEDLKKELPGMPILGAMMQGDNLYALPRLNAAVVVIGNEGNGISAAAEALLTRKITIPAPVGAGAESLNAAIAAAIIAGRLTYGQ